MSDKYEFPLLMRSTATGLVLLVEKYSTIHGRVSGTVKSLGHGHSHSLNTVGDYRDDWCLSVFEPFEPIMCKTKE